MSATGNRLGVLGSPISHSRSPLLHRAAYAALGLPWVYDAIDLTEDALPQFLASRTSDWRGLSLTMPLKRAVIPLLDSVDATAAATGAANTVLFDDVAGERALRGFNTDVNGIVEAFRAAGVHELTSVRLLGSGATATSALLAVSRLGARQVDISARTPSRAAPLERLGEQLGVRVRVEQLGSGRIEAQGEAVISTIPRGAPSSVSFSEETMQGSLLFEVTYDPWPTHLASAWQSVGGRVVWGLEMLMHQALGQVRIFVGGDPEVPLDNDVRVLEAMRASIAAH
ncbi:shikimate dehydrogenase [Parafrigoribacterium soli]|uniref:shikimate dehydrogenase n=1 Tax=Parafrigoribacterium soli TaxID=3144663 RepID=UPI0032EC4F86